jgi:uncharacterized protein YabN with tetrapyrrole methylase and pyrophosphatase domain
VTSGALTVIGTGIRAIGHVTLEARNVLRGADRVVYLVADPLTEKWILDLRPEAESLYDLYAEGKPRLETYHEMVERILQGVRAGSNVCAAFYGHPGVFVHPSFEAIRVAREEGYQAVMLPGISADSCMFADLEIDPSAAGCQTYEATEFLVRPRRYDERTSLILWQIGLVGRFDFQLLVYESNGLTALVQMLADRYGTEHMVVIYEAALYPLYDSRIERVRLTDLPDADLSSISTLFVPPTEPATVDQATVARLGLTLPQGSVGSTSDAIYRRFH